MAFSIDDVLEKELRGWKEKETEGYMVLGDGDFDAEIDIKELVKLLEESEYCEVKKEAEEATWRDTINTSWSSFFSRYDIKNFDNTTWQEVHIVAYDEKQKVEIKALPEHMEYALLEVI